MNDVWQILELTANDADEKKVRSAYARLLKLNRPDLNPEGFRRLRHAYEMALQWLCNRVLEEPGPAPLRADPPPTKTEPVPAATEPASTAEALDAPQSPADIPHRSSPPPDRRSKPTPKPAATAPMRDWPRQWSYSVHALNAALQAAKEHGPAESQIRVHAALQALAVDTREHVIPANALKVIIEDAFGFSIENTSQEMSDGRFQCFASAVPDLLLLQLLESGPEDFVQRVVCQWMADSFFPRAAQFASTLAAMEGDWFHEANASTVFEMATFLAFHRSELAQELQMKLARQLDNEDFAQEFLELDRAIKRGRMFRHLKTDMRNFWQDRLAGLGAADWTSPLARLALYDAVARGSKWVGFETARELVPPEVWQAAWSRRWLRKAGAVLVSAKNTVCIFPVFIGCLVFFTLAGAVRSCNITNSRVNASPRHKYKSKQQREEEFRKVLNKAYQDAILKQSKNER